MHMSKSEMETPSCSRSLPFGDGTLSFSRTRMWYDAPIGQKQF